jgi:hypothetical protein
MQSSSLLFAHDQDTSRRKFVTSFILSAGASIVNPLTSSAVTRAVGSGEESCRAAGNCLEVGEWDGAVGWSWGGKERCDPTDPLCGADGSLRESLKGKPVPRPVSDITHIALIRVDIGRKESGVLKLGLYGNDCPGSTSELIEFLSQGLSTFAKEENTMRLMTTPVSLATGGVVSFITPGSIVELGVPSQSNAYGRSRGLSQVDAFVPQKRPDEGITVNDKIVRSHDAAGLLSLSLKGLGYGGTGFETDDECYESAFIITADSDSAPSLNKNRRVVGQILDSDSMAFLERLANLPTKRGIRGVIPGQTMGPPLLHVTVRDIAVSKVNGSASQQSNAS